MFIKKLVSVVLCLVLLMASVVALIPEMNTKVAAATYRTAANGPSSSYKGSKYYQHFLKIPLTGDGPTDTLALALSQLGYHEGASVSDMAGNSSSSGNYTEYNYNMGNWGSDYTYEWCATFCSWALYQAQVTNQNSINDWARKHIGDPNYVWREVGCPSWIQNLKAVGMWKYSQYHGGSYKPQSGDLIFFNSGGHIGMVVYSDSSYVYTVEGNTSDAAGVEPAGGGVFFKKYALGASYIDGYGVLPYKTNSNVVKIDYSGANPSTGLYITNVAKYLYPSETSTTASGTIPKYAMFEVTEIASNGRLKAKYTNTSGSTVEGWVLNNADRVIQLTSNVSNEKVSMTLKCVDEKGNTLKSETITGNKGASATITPPAITGYAPTQSTVTVVYKSGDTVTIKYKTVLDSAIDAATGTRYCDYTPSALATLRSVYDQAVAMQKNTSATSNQKIQMATQLQNAINNTIYKETVISKNKTYTASPSYRPDGDKWIDDGKRLTDGTKGNKGDTLGFAGWNVGANGSAEIVVDLGSNASSSVYRIYTSVCGDEWGIFVPTKLTVSVSKDNKTFTQIGYTDSETATTVDGIWTNYYMTVRADSVRTERYVKFTVSATKGAVWLEEVEVASAAIGAKDEIYVDGINTAVTNGKAVVFTPAFGDITVAKANHKDTLNIVAKWNGSDNSYVVKSVTKGKGDSTPTIKLASDEILIAANSWEVNVTDPVYFSNDNVAKLNKVAVGNKLYLNNVNVSGATLGAAATVSLTAQGGNANENLVYDKDYTTTTPNRNDAWDDDGAKLTDGAKGQINVNSVNNGKTYYSGWNAPDATKGFSVELFFDLGSAKKSDTYTAYMAGGNWGIALPKDVISMEVYVSDKANSGYELVATAPVGSAVLADTLDKWSTYTITATADKAVSARYVKVVLTHKPVESEDGKAYIWIDEVEVFNTKSDDTAKPDIYYNAALGKDYEGGDISPAGSYSANLTDGEANTIGAFDSTWYALYYNKDATADKITAPNGIGTIIIDLEEVVNGISDVNVHVWNCNANGILPAKSITLFVSKDGKTYTEIGELDIPNGDDPDWATISTDNISARYVKLVVETQAVWTFLNEIQVIANSDANSTFGELGDVDFDGDVDAADYILVKRAVLKNYTLSDEQSVVADIDKDGDVDAADYVLVKRMVLGTYKA